MSIGYMSSRAVVVAFAIAFTSSVGAASQETADAAPTREMRNKMAAVHDKVAACLRSDRPLAECHSEMMEGCRSVGAHACPMMDMKMEHKGRRPSDKSMDEAAGKED